MDLVRKLRLEKGWSQEHLAAASGVSRATVQRIEAGKVRPSKEIAQDLAAALGCDAARLRVAAGLAVLVCRAMTRVNAGQRPSPALLQRLPEEYRATFEEHCDARDEVDASQAAFEGEVARHGAVFESGERLLPLDSFFASSDRCQAALKKFNSTWNRVAVMLLRFCA